MAKRRAQPDGASTGDAKEKDGLSPQILGLITAAKVDERRKPKRKRTAPAGERRRRTDLDQLS